MFKKTAIAALVLGFSGAASAAMYAPAPAPACAAGNVTVPCERSAWDLGVDALYMRAENTQSSFRNNYRADYGWGFRLEGSYHFGTGNDATINWMHFNRGTDGTFTTAAGGNLRVQQRSKLDWVNLEMGQQVDFGENVDMRFHGGLMYITSVDNETIPNGVDFKASGFGPRAGLMMKYDFGNGFGVYGDSAMGLLVGKVETRGVNTGTNYGTALTTEGSVGVAYTHAMAQGDLMARIGWGAKEVGAGVGGDSWSGFNFGLKWVGNV